MNEHATRLLSIRARLGDLNHDELEAFDVQLSRLEMGISTHGHLVIDNDPRNWLDEMTAEFGDACWYWAFQMIKQRRAAARMENPIEAGLRELVANAPFTGEAP